MKNIRITTTIEKVYESLKEIDLPLHYKNHEFNVVCSDLDTMTLTILASEWGEELTNIKDLSFEINAYDLLEKIGFEIDVTKCEFMDGNTMTYDKHPTVNGDVLPEDVVLELASEIKNVQAYLEAVGILPTNKTK